jgi:hypothetical protein
MVQVHEVIVDGHGATWAAIAAVDAVRIAAAPTASINRNLNLFPLTNPPPG